jgi:hypothetical protein
MYIAQVDDYFFLCIQKERNVTGTSIVNVIGTVVRGFTESNGLR